ncbi:MAG: nuclear transport factor 2 family protein [Elusimicrobia bacterium]|nr:nuclear transport factor 2 family protein [Elusimicrobiota bacterium]
MAVTIQCEKCGAPGTPERVECAKCKGRVVRVCGDCGLANSLAKKYCDNGCGRIDGPSTPKKEAAAPPPPPPPKAEPAKAPPAAEKFVFETLAESAANELEEHERKKAAAPLKLPDLPRPVEKKPEPAAPPPPPPPPPPMEAPASIPPVGLNPPPSSLKPVEGLKLDTPAEAKPARKTDLGLPHTVIGRAVPKAPEAKAPEKKPPVREPEPPKRASSPAAAPPPPPAPKPKPSPAPSGGIDGVRKVEKLTQSKAHVGSQTAAKVSTALALVLLLSGGALWLARRRHMQKSEVQLPITARRYLTAMKSGDFTAAYGMLSEASKRSATIEELKNAREGMSWDFSDVALASVDGDLAFVRYRLKIDAREPEENTLVFKQEGGAWRRAFSWNLLRNAEAALDRGDGQQALAAAQAALAVNARDPLAQVYVCEAYYALRNPSFASQLEKECRAALEVPAGLPPALAPEPAALNHVRAVLGDTFKNVLRRYRDAMDQYNAVLTFGKATPTEQCELLLGRAECSLALQDAPNAVQDFTKAMGVCDKPADADYARRSAAVYSGNAQKEAIELAQQHHVEGGQTVAEWRKEERARLTKEWKQAGRGPVPAEDWQAQHLGGSQYRVDVRAGSAVLFSARVDLWTKVVVVETR